MCTLQSVVETLPKKEVNIIMGDFNSCVGEGVERESGIGQYGLGSRNESGDLRTDFCQANDMVITNTTFQQLLSRRRIWLHPDKRRYQIDYLS